MEKKPTSPSTDEMCSLITDDEKLHQHLEGDVFYNSSMKEELLKNFSIGFSKFIHRRKLKVSDVANKFGLTHSAVSSWKNGNGFPDFLSLSKLLFCGMTLNEIFGDDNGHFFTFNSLKDNPGITEGIEKNVLENYVSKDVFNEMKKAMQEALTKGV